MALQLTSHRAAALQRSARLSGARPAVSVPVSIRKISERRVAAKAASEPGGEDFDAILIKFAEKFEKSENKVAVVGYISAAIFAFFFAEWFIHLPALDILLGFPIQVVGLLAIPVLVQRYYLSKSDFAKDAGEIINSYTAQLPGLKKE